MAEVSRAVERARSGDDRIDVAITLALAGTVYSLWGDRRRALATARDARRIAEATGTRMSISNACICAGLAPDLSGIGMSTDELESTIQRAEPLAYGFQEILLTLLRAQLAYARADMDAALEHVGTMSELIARQGVHTFVAPILLAEAEIRIRKDGGAARADVEKLLASAHASIERLGTRLFAPRVHVVRAGLESAAGDDAAAEREREAARRLYEEMGAPVPDDLVGP